MEVPKESGAGSSVDSGNVQEASVREEPFSLQDMQKKLNDIEETFQNIHKKIDNSCLPETLSENFQKTLENLFKKLKFYYEFAQGWEIMADNDKAELDNLKKMASEMGKDLDRWSSIQKAKESLEPALEHYTTRGYDFLVSTLADKAFNTDKAAYEQILEGYQQGRDLSDARRAF